MTPLLVAIPGNEKLTEDLAATLHYELGRLKSALPDGETYLRSHEPHGHSVEICLAPQREIAAADLCGNRAELTPQGRSGGAFTLMRQDRR
jgi:hypothetical protein